MNKVASILKMANRLDRKGFVKLADKLTRFAFADEKRFQEVMGGSTGDYSTRCKNCGFEFYPSESFAEEKCPRCHLSRYNLDTQLRMPSIDKMPSWPPNVPTEWNPQKRLNYSDFNKIGGPIPPRPQNVPNHAEWNPKNGTWSTISREGNPYNWKTWDINGKVIFSNEKELSSPDADGFNQFYRSYLGKTGEFAQGGNPPIPGYSGNPNWLAAPGQQTPENFEIASWQ